MSWRDRIALGRDEAAGEQLARQATAAIAGLLAERNLSRTQLAERMGISPGRVSQILSGDENLTLRSLANIAESLDVGVEVNFVEPPLAGQSGRDHTKADGGPVHPYVPAQP
ncbi:helix-turn-helix transcriptional regulator [Streptomyces sp. NPDC046853]|uniref:helix-turn-helix domain-containing protein n=1 Tax=Streptomyces sp. NPDC046853 TaxID=3154920 RepID=UPI0033D6CFF9